MSPKEVRRKKSRASILFSLFCKSVKKLHGSRVRHFLTLKLMERERGLGVGVWGEGLEILVKDYLDITSLRRKCPCRINRNTSSVSLHIFKKAAFSAKRTLSTFFLLCKWGVPCIQLDSSLSQHLSLVTELCALCFTARVKALDLRTHPLSSCLAFFFFW